MSHDQDLFARQVLFAFRVEAIMLTTAMYKTTPLDWTLPTRCSPWNVAALFGHVLTAVARICDMLDAPAPSAATVNAAGYFQPDARFSPLANAERVEAAARMAADVPVTDLLVRFDVAWREVLLKSAREPIERVVRTRHGGAMLLTDFLQTRVLEMGVHGLDLAAALGRPPWLTPPRSRY